MDAKAVRALWGSMVLLALVVAVFLIGKSAWGQDILKGLELWMEQYRHSPMAVVIVIVVFCVSALFGAPQFVLIAACVVAFGPWWGGFYSWVATVVSAVMTFYMGRFAGAGVMSCPACIRSSGSTVYSCRMWRPRRAIFSVSIDRGISSTLTA